MHHLMPDLAFAGIACPYGLFSPGEFSCTLDGMVGAELCVRNSCQRVCMDDKAFPQSRKSIVALHDICHNPLVSEGYVTKKFAHDWMGKFCYREGLSKRLRRKRVETCRSRFRWWDLNPWLCRAHGSWQRLFASYRNQWKRWKIRCRLLVLRQKLRAGRNCHKS